MLDRRPDETMVGAQPRARGAVRLATRRVGEASAIAALRQEGSLKVLFPQGRDASLEAVLLNTAGGLTGGDSMSIAAEALPGAALRLSTQAAERAYRATGDDVARVETGLTVGAGAVLHWLPQETLLYDGSALDRRLIVDLAPDATVLLCEAVVLGRRAMGETVRTGRFRERWDIRRDGRLIYADRLRLQDDMAATLARSGAAATFATIVLAGPGASARLAEIRDLLPASGGASLPEDDLLLVRLLAEDGFSLRRALVPILESLGRRPLPKVWRL